MLRAGCEQRFIDVANWILGATRNAKGLGVNTAREEGVQPLREGRKPRENATRKILLYRSSPLLLEFLTYCRVRVSSSSISGFGGIFSPKVAYRKN